MKKKIVLYTFCAALVLISPAYAIVLGGSNLDFMGYPKHKCSIPTKPYEFTEQYQVASYNRDVEEYISCIKKYVANAEYDIERIQESAKAAIDEANSL